MKDFITLFVALTLLAADRPATEVVAAWKMWDTNGDAVWDAARLIGLAGANERSWARTPPIYVGEGLNRDHRNDLNRLRARDARPATRAVCVND